MIKSVFMRIENLIYFLKMEKIEKKFDKKEKIEKLIFIILTISLVHLNI